jgi:molybdenum cofactor cytidylyltransferase
VNLLAVSAGLLQSDAEHVLALNMVDEAITIAILRPSSPVRADAIVATVKVIPYAGARRTVEIAAARREMSDFGSRISLGEC